MTYNFEDYGIEAALADLWPERLKQLNYETCVMLGIIAVEAE